MRELIKKRVEKKIRIQRHVLDFCIAYADKERTLKESQKLDILINRYYKLKNWGLIK